MGGEGDDRGWDGCMASLTQWIWVWVNSGSWWWIGRPGMLQSLGSQRVGHDWVTDLNWTDIDVTLNISISKSMQSLSKIIIAYVSYCIFVQSLKVFSSWIVQWSDRIHRTCTHV